MSSLKLIGAECVEVFHITRLNLRKNMLCIECADDSHWIENEAKFIYKASSLCVSHYREIRQFEREYDEYIKMLGLE